MLLVAAACRFTALPTTSAHAHTAQRNACLIIIAERSCQAIAICEALGATVVGTVGRADKVAVLLKRFPFLQPSQIVVRADSAKQFGLDVVAALKSVRPSAQGFDIVLDAVLGDYFQPGFDALASGGRYIVYGAASMTPTHASMGWLSWAKLAWQWLWRPKVDPLELPGLNKSVMGFNLIHCFNEAELLLQLLDEIDALKLPPPLVGRVFEFKQCVEALRLLQSGATVGKVVLTTARAG